MTLSIQQMKKADDVLVQCVQHEFFEEVSYASQADQDKQLQKSSVLHKLDSTLLGGILRVGGRLGRSDMPSESKHPIILPKNSPTSTLIIEELTEQLVIWDVTWFLRDFGKCIG